MSILISIETSFSEIKKISFEIPHKISCKHWMMQIFLQWVIRFKSSCSLLKQSPGHQVHMEHLINTQSRVSGRECYTNPWIGMTGSGRLHKNKTADKTASRGLGSHWNGYSVILMKFSSLAVLEVVNFQHSHWWIFHQNDNIFVSMLQGHISA